MVAAPKTPGADRKAQRNLSGEHEGAFGEVLTPEQAMERMAVGRTGPCGGTRISVSKLQEGSIQAADLPGAPAFIQSRNLSPGPTGDHAP